MHHHDAPAPLRAGSQGLQLLNALTSDPASGPSLGLDGIEDELRAFEREERERLGITEAPVDHWVDENPQTFTSRQRAHTTMLLGGLTYAQDLLVQAGLSGIGYRVEAMDVPDYAALHVGKEFGNRGQCNPTYFTVGNLVKHLIRLRDEEGIPTRDVIENYVFLTAGSCGPCRFGTYTTEYRKALRDAGFEGFRVLLFQQQGGLKQATGDDPGLDLNPRFFATIITAIMAGDVLNAIGYRIRPYEVRAGATDETLTECREMLSSALLERRSVLRTLRRCKKLLAKVEVDRIQAKPKVSIIGEFWAMTTEGDGNYRLQRFLEQEGAEVEIQLVSAWILYNIWQHRWDTHQRMTLRGTDDGKNGLAGKDVRKKLVSLWVAEKLLRGAFRVFAIGLSRYPLPDLEEIATISHAYYRNELRGGEGHMEVGKLIQSVEKRKAHMVLSVKPFGCMPSSSVSDGVQSLIVKKHPEAIYCPIETSGDGAVNVQSRVQMYMFKARRRARAETEATLAERGLTPDDARDKLGRRASTPLHHPRHEVAGTAANLVHGLG